MSNVHLKIKIRRGGGGGGGVGYDLGAHIETALLAASEAIRGCCCHVYDH